MATSKARTLFMHFLLFALFQKVAVTGLVGTPAARKRVVHSDKTETGKHFIEGFDFFGSRFSPGILGTSVAIRQGGMRPGGGRKKAGGELCALGVCSDQSGFPTAMPR